MNDVIKTIKNRRSVRKFREDQIKDDELHEIIESGLSAPSGHNDQSWYFTVVRNRDILNDISEGSKSEMRKSAIDWIAGSGRNENLRIFYNAPLAIIVSARKDAVSPLVDACAAIENMMIAAESLNIGSCWIGFSKFYFNNPESYKKLGIPEGYEAQYAVAFGYKPEGLKLTPPEKKREKYYNIIN